MSVPTPRSADPAARPLAGVRVLDVSRVVSGPFATRLLSDLGADVVKIEPPVGDETRAYGLRIGGLSGSYIQQNVGKSNVCIDLKAPGGRELLLRMAEVADLMVENFRPGVLDRLGIGWGVLRQHNPGLILLSITGFGQYGPASARKAYAPVIHAETGLVARQAHFDARPPSDPMPSVADTNASLHGVIAALAALHMRGRTGVGQHIDIAMTDAMLTTDDYSHHALDDFPILRVGGDVWEAPGGQLLTAGLFELNWQRMSASYPDVFAPDAAGYADAPVRMAAVQRWISDFPGRSELLEALDTAGVPWADVRQPMDVFDSDWARARQTCAEIDDRAGGTRRVVQSPYKYSDAHSGLVPRIAFRGEDNETALRRWLDVDADELEELATAGVLLAESVGAPED
ncbi:MAG TPA: CaiB/BaiF CoA-transferase family protein [Mycobacteriales bacterium]